MLPLDFILTPATYTTLQGIANSLWIPNILPKIQFSLLFSKIVNLFIKLSQHPSVCKNANRTDFIV